MGQENTKDRVQRRLWNRNFILLWQGQLVSSLGKQAFALAAMLWLKDVTGSGSLMGLLMTAALLPPVLLGPLAGVIVDVWDRKRIIAWTDLAGGVLILGAAALFLWVRGETGLLVATVFAVTLLTGLLDTFSQPSISASIPDIVPTRRLEAANSLNQAGVHVAVFAAQGVAGFLYRLLGAPLLVLANALTYLYAGTTELFLRIPRLPPRSDREGLHPLRRFQVDFIEGWDYLKVHRGLRTLILVYALLNFFISPLLVLLPFFVQDYLGLSADWYGFLMAAFGAGAMVGFLVAGVAPTRGRARELAVSAGLILQSALIAALLLWRLPGGQVALFAAIGLLNGLVNVNVLTLTQLTVPAELRGRVQSLMTTVIAGIMPLGMALGGILFDLSGQNVPLLLGASGALTFLTSVASLAVKDYRAFLASDEKAAASR
jgi:MFS family permease